MKKHNKSSDSGEEQKVRVRFPRDKELVGMIDQRVGGSRMLVKCTDGKTRNCKVPGRLRRGMWLREGDYVIVEPWEFDNTKGSIMFKYNPNAVSKLKEKNLHEGIETDEL